MTKASTALEFMGVPGSPYTRKMLALLRYRRIPYRLLPGSRNLLNPDPKRFRSRPEPKVPLLPTFYFTDDRGVEKAVTDSSPLLQKFDQDYADRKVLCSDPLLRLVDLIIEDYADEWLTKAMFHYRWSYAADIDKAGQILPRWANLTAPELDIAEQSETIRDKQISRLAYVGSNPVTHDTIESSFKQFIQLLAAHLKHSQFVLGERPSACDFAIYGQLTCLALFDPTPQAIILSQTPQLYAWTEVMEDLSGYEVFDDDWISSAELPHTLLDMLCEIGKIYPGYLLANAQAVTNGDKLMHTTLDGRPWQQNPFPYQLKCLHWLRDAFRDLSPTQQRQFLEMIKSSGLEALFIV